LTRKPENPSKGPKFFTVGVQVSQSDALGNFISPLQGLKEVGGPFTQGFTLGYYIAPFQGFNKTLKNHNWRDLEN